MNTLQRRFFTTNNILNRFPKNKQAFEFEQHAKPQRRNCIAPNSFPVITRTNLLPFPPITFFVALQNREISRFTTNNHLFLPSPSRFHSPKSCFQARLAWASTFFSFSRGNGYCPKKMCICLLWVMLKTSERKRKRKRKLSLKPHDEKNRDTTQARERERKKREKEREREREKRKCVRIEPKYKTEISYGLRLI